MKKQSKKSYNLPDENFIMNIVQKLWNDKDSLMGTTINWETWTVDYFQEDLPDNDLDEIYWKRWRVIVKKSH